MYKDPYNNAVVAKQQANVRRHATRIDQLNGSGTGGANCPRNYAPVSDPKTGKQYNNKCEMSVAQSTGGASCCARCSKCKCRGMGMSGGGPATPIAAKEWFKAEDQSLKRAIAQTITPDSVRESRMKADLGAGKPAVGGRKKCGGSIPNMTNDYGNVTPQGLTSPATARLLMNKNLGAGKKSRGGAKKEEHYEDDELVGGGADEDTDYSGSEYDDDEELTGGGAEGEYDDEPDTLREMKSICDDYEQKKLTGGAMTKRVRAMLPHGKKGMSVSLSKMLQKLKKRGRSSFNRRLKLGMMVPQLVKKHAEGNGRYVGGSKDYGEIQSIHDSVFGGSKLTGGYGPVAPTTEALAGYDNRNQPKGLMPPPSVNQQPGMRGGASLPFHQDKRGGNMNLRTWEMKPEDYGSLAGMGSAGSRVRGTGHPLIPVAQLPSKIGGGKGKLKGGLRTAPNGDYIGPSTGAIIPNLQSEVSPAGSGKRSNRGAMVAKLMREKNMSLGEASKALKGGAYTANDFFMPRNAHQFFGAYA